MPKVVREDIDNLNAVLTITLEKSDYEPKLKKELNEYSQKASMKGFRKGKTPISVVKKMYGKQLLADIVNKSLSEEINAYLADNPIKYFAQPLPSENQVPVTFDLKNLKDFVFKFDLGLEPDFEIKGISEEDTYKRYEVTIPEKDVEDALQNARKRLGQQTHPEDNIEENDIVKFEVTELDGEVVKEGGLITEFSSLVSDIPDEDVKAKILNSKMGDIVRFNIYQMEKARPDEEAHKKFVRKHLMNLSDEDKREVGEMFDAEIVDVTRAEVAELNQEFFDKAFGKDRVSNEEEARKRIELDIKKYYDQQADALLFMNLRKQLLEENKIPMPTSFLRRWIKESNQDNPKVTDEVIDKEFDDFIENTRWSLITNRVAEQNELKVTNEDIIAKMAQELRGQYGDLDDNILKMLGEQMLKDERQQDQVNQLAQKALADKVLHTIKSKVNIDNEPISVEGLMEVITKIQTEAALKQVAHEAKELDEVKELDTADSSEEG